MSSKSSILYNCNYWLIFLTCSFLKILTVHLYHSTDFEVHRHWLAITSHLPRNSWYFDASSEHTLDYPPLFAFGQYILGLFITKVFSQFDSDITTLTQHDYKSIPTLYFQHLTVILTDLLLFVAILRCIQILFRSNSTSPTSSSSTATKTTSQQQNQPQSIFQQQSQQLQTTQSRIKLITLISIIFFSPALFLVDHIHFQYNGFLLGLLLLSISFHLEQRHYTGALLFTFLLWFKHIFAYSIPGYTLYLLFTFVYDYNNNDKSNILSNNYLQQYLTQQPSLNNKPSQLPSKRIHITRLITLGLIVLVTSIIVLIPTLFCELPHNIAVHQAQKQGLILLHHTDNDFIHPKATNFQYPINLDQYQQFNYTKLINRYDFKQHSDQSNYPYTQPQLTFDPQNSITTQFLVNLKEFLPDYSVLANYDPNLTYPINEIPESDPILVKSNLIGHKLQAIVHKIPFNWRSKLLNCFNFLASYLQSTQFSHLNQHLTQYLLTQSTPMVKIIQHPTQISQMIQIEVETNVVNRFIDTLFFSFKLNLQQLRSRLFPFRRGVIHSYWASNVYSLYVFVDWIVPKINKLKAIPFIQNRIKSMREINSLHPQPQSFNASRLFSRQDVAMELTSLSPTDLNCIQNNPCTKKLPQLVTATSGLVGELELQWLPRITTGIALALTFVTTMFGLSFIFVYIPTLPKLSNSTPHDQQRNQSQDGLFRHKITSSDHLSTLFLHPSTKITLIDYINHRNSLKFIYALVWSNLCSFGFGWHVHEKAVLLILVPLMLTLIIDLYSIEQFNAILNQHKKDGNDNQNNTHYNRNQQFSNTIHHLPPQLQQESKSSSLFGILSLLSLVTMVPLFPQKSLEQILVVFLLFTFLFIYHGYTQYVKYTQYPTLTAKNTTFPFPDSYKQSLQHSQNLYSIVYLLLTGFVVSILPLYWVGLYFFPGVAFLPTMAVSVLSGMVFCFIFVPMLFFHITQL